MKHNINENTSDLPATHKKIQLLHKMLDKQISTVNSVFGQTNAFDQISSKLKELQVKLENIKQPENTINHKSVIKQQQSHFASGKNQSQDYMTSLSTNKIKTSRGKNKEGESGRKLIFDINEESKENQTFVLRKQKKNRIQSAKSTKINSHRKSMNPQKESIQISQKKKSRSKSIQQKKHKPLTRQNSVPNTIKKRAMSVNKLDKNNDTSKKQNKNTISKTGSWVNIVTTYSSSKGDKKNKNEHINKVAQIVAKNQNKRLEKELVNYKTKTQNLQGKVKELRGYKVEYEKLKKIFEKQQRLRKAKFYD